MSLCHQGLDVKLTDTAVTVTVSAAEPLLALANALDWCQIAHLAIPDLKRTTKGCWYLGRRLSLRSHLAVMILQTLLKETDRGMEKRIQHTPVLQVFCGASVLPDWRCPDHTKIEELRNRLSPETHRAIGEYVLQVAQHFGFADASWMDVDFTVQEANIGYPAGARGCPGTSGALFDQVRLSGWRYLLDVGHFVRTHALKPGKSLAFRAQAVACIKKGKVGKPHEFGRVFQLGRIGGNFLIPFPCTDVRMQDKQSLLMNMRHPAFAALCAACVLAIGIPASIGLTAVGADEKTSRPLSQVPKVERFGQAALDAQAAFLRRMPDTEIRYGENGAISWLKGRTGIVLPSGLAQFKVGQASKELLEHIGPALLAAGTEELRVTAIANEAGKADPVERQSSPERGVNFIQYIRGREVQNSAVNIVLNQQTNEITLVVANFLPDRGLPEEPQLTAAEARAKVEAAMREIVLPKDQRFTFQDYPASLAYAFEEIGYNGGVGGALVWVFQIIKDGLPAEVNVNALTGQVVSLRSVITAFLPNRDSYDAHYNFLAPPNGMTFLFGEAGPPLPITDPIPAAAYNKAGLAFAAFANVFGRNSWDNAGGTIRLVSHYGTTFGNGYYSPGGWLMFTDGEVGKKSTAEDLDAVTHELTGRPLQCRSAGRLAKLSLTETYWSANRTSRVILVIGGSECARATAAAAAGGVRRASWNIGTPASKRQLAGRWSIKMARR